MALPTIVTQILEANDAYIKHSAKEAAEYFERKKISHVILDGKMQFTAHDCELQYKDLIVEMLVNKHNVNHRRGLWAAVIPKRLSDDQLLVHIYCGICFHDVENDSSKQTDGPNVV